MRTSFHHQPEAQHPKSSAIHKLPADYPIFLGYSGREMLAVRPSHFGPEPDTQARNRAPRSRPRGGILNKGRSRSKPSSTSFAPRR
jgi:hypothetical protein